MYPKALYILASGAAVITLVFFLSGYLQKDRQDPAPQPPAPPTDLDITIERSNSGRVYKYEGALKVPACNTYGSTFMASGDDPAYLTITFTLDPEELCEMQEETIERFSFSYEPAPGAAAPVLVEVLVNDFVANVTTIER